jgi:hypothetical protein
MFDSADFKVKRAQEHIGNLEKAFDRFIKTHPYTFHVGNDSDANTRGIEVRFGEAIPTMFSLILGDAIHNLRTALDHAAWELIGIDCGTQDRTTTFPVSRTQADYEAACKGIKTLKDDTKKFFIALAAYPGGAGEKLYGLNRLDNADKHTILTPIIGMARVGHLEVIRPDGKTLLTMDNCRFGMGPNGRTQMIGGLGPGFTIKLDQNTETTLEIFFGDVEVFKTLPLVETLMNLSYSVSDVIGQFVNLVEART